MPPEKFIFFFTMLDGFEQNSIRWTYMMHLTLAVHSAHLVQEHDENKWSIQVRKNYRL
jgi:hypothetical protein